MIHDLPQAGVQTRQRPVGAAPSGTQTPRRAAVVRDELGSSLEGFVLAFPIVGWQNPRLLRLALPLQQRLLTLCCGRCNAVHGSGAPRGSLASRSLFNPRPVQLTKPSIATRSASPAGATQNSRRTSSGTKRLYRPWVGASSILGTCESFRARGLPAAVGTAYARGAALHRQPITAGAEPAMVSLSPAGPRKREIADCPDGPLCNHLTQPAVSGSLSFSNSPFATCNPSPVVRNLIYLLILRCELLELPI